MVIAGPTGSGKTVWCQKLLKEHLFTENITGVLYCYGVYQDFYDNFQVSLEIEFHEGIPSKEKLEQFADGSFKIVVLDDLMSEISNSEEMMNLFTRYCHHLHISAIFISQNLFVQGKYSRTISLNTHILVLFENKRDFAQISFLARQLFPGQSSFFMEVFEQATDFPFGYLVVDCSPQSHKKIKLRTHIFPSDNKPCVVFLKK